MGTPGWNLRNLYYHVFSHTESQNYDVTFLRSPDFLHSVVPVRMIELGIIDDTEINEDRDLFLMLAPGYATGRYNITIPEARVVIEDDDGRCMQDGILVYWAASLKQGLSSRMMMVGACRMGSWYTERYKCMRDWLQVCMLLVVIIVTHEANPVIEAIFTIGAWSDCSSWSSFH